MPGGTCKVCSHPKRRDIDLALIQGLPTRSIAKQFGATSAGVFRHSKHLPKKLVRAKQVSEEIYAGAVIDQMQALYRETAEDREVVRAEGNYELVLRHTHFMMRMLEIKARILGELKDSGGINVNGPINVTVQYEQRTLVSAISQRQIGRENPLEIAS